MQAGRRYRTIVKRNAAGADFTPAVFVAVIVSVYVPGLSFLEDETRPWKRTLFEPR
jgi:hypothetical protein